MEGEAMLERFVNRYVYNFSKREERFNLENPNQVIDGYTVGEILGGSERTKSSVNVTVENSLSLSAVYRCVAILSGIISYLPKKVYRDTDGGREEAKDHSTYTLFRRRMHPHYTTSVFFERAIIHLLLRGNHLAEIIFKKNEPAGFELINPQSLKEITVGNSGRLWYHFTDRRDPIPSDRMIHVPHLGENPIQGKGVITYAREDVGMEMARRDTGAKFWADGARPEGMIIPQQKISATQAAELKETFKAKKKEGGTIVGPFGVDYVPLSMAPADQEFIMSGNFTVAQICRWFGVPLDKLSELSRATMNNIEHQAIAFLQDTIAPIVNKIENEYTSKLYTLENEQSMYMEMNMDAYQRADSQAQAEMMRSEIQNGGMTPNEWRKIKNRPAKEGGDDIFIQQNMAPVGKLEQILMQKKSPAKLINSIRELAQLAEIEYKTNGNGNH